MKQFARSVVPPCACTVAKLVAIAMVTTCKCEHDWSLVSQWSYGTAAVSTGYSASASAEQRKQMRTHPSASTWTSTECSSQHLLRNVTSAGWSLRDAAIRPHTGCFSSCSRWCWCVLRRSISSLYKSLAVLGSRR